MSRSSIKDDESGEKVNYAPRTDAVSTMYNIVREMCLGGKDKTVKIEDIERKVLSRGFSKQQLEGMLEEYKNINCLYINTTGTEVTLL